MGKTDVEVSESVAGSEAGREMASDGADFQTGKLKRALTVVVRLNFSRRDRHWRNVRCFDGNYGFLILKDAFNP